MKKSIFLITTLLLFTTIIKTSAQTADVQKKIKQVEQNILPDIQTNDEGSLNIKDRMAFYKVHGLSIAVIYNYKLEWAKGYGMADDSLGIPVTAKTLFQAGSVSKSLNAVGLLKLVQDKKLDLYTDINDALTSWKFPYDSVARGKKISLINLLSHTAGVNLHGYSGYRRDSPLPNTVQTITGEKPANSPRVHSVFEPGLKYQYSGGGVMISQLIAMDITHQPYDKFMYSNVLKPMGMTESTYEQPPLNVPPAMLATAYYADGRQMPMKYNIYPEQAAAGLWTNPTDLAKYIIETQLAYSGKSAKVLNQAYTELRLTPYIDKSAALGVFIDDLDGEQYFQHGGTDAGFQTQYYGSLTGGNGVVVMVNSIDGWIIEEIINSVANVYNFKGLNHSKKTVAIADSTLQAYVGKYEIDAKTIIAITREGNHLFGLPPRGPKLELYPLTQSRFALKQPGLEVEFVKDNNGKAIKALFYQNGVQEGKKIE